MEILFSWTVWFPEDIKIRDAYQMLKKQGLTPLFILHCLSHSTCFFLPFLCALEFFGEIFYRTEETETSNFQYLEMGKTFLLMGRSQAGCEIVVAVVTLATPDFRFLQR